MKKLEIGGSKTSNGVESRNPPSGRRLREMTPKRSRDATPKKRSNREKTPVKISSRALKNREKNPAGKRDSSSNRKRENTPNRSRNSTPLTTREPTQSRSRNSTPLRSTQKPRGRTPIHRKNNKLKTKPMSPAKSRDKTPGKSRRGMSRFKKGGKKNKPHDSSLPPRVSTEENSLDNDPSELGLKEKLLEKAQQFTPRPPPEEVQNTRKRETKKKPQHVESPKRNRQRKQSEEIEFVADEAKCGGSPFLKSADDAVLCIGSYFGRGIVAIVDGVKDSNCVQGKPPSAVIGRFSCNAGGTFDTGIPESYENLAAKTKRGYLYDDEGNPVARDTVSKQY